MKLIKPSVSAITETNPLKKIELIGRTCYKSSSDMTEESARKFFNGLVSREHYAMVEHATFVFKVTCRLYRSILDVIFQDDPPEWIKYLHYTHSEDAEGNSRYLISGNLRTLNEMQNGTIFHALRLIDPALAYAEDPNAMYSDCIQDIEYVPDISKLPNLQYHEFMAHYYMTLKFICDRGVSHELVRHRPCSFAQESTRYCNYSKEKFGSELTFIEPAGFCDDSISWNPQSQATFLKILKNSEDDYFRFLCQCGRIPQVARAVLDCALKTEVCMTANAKEWVHFFDLRSIGITGAPHPDMKVVADLAYAIFQEEEDRILGRVTFK